MADQLLFPKPRSQQRNAIPLIGINQMLERAPMGNSQCHTAVQLLNPRPKVAHHADRR